MVDFRRTGSKVWWASETMEYRDSTASPGSQDSGFSDTENSPPMRGNQPKAKEGTPSSTLMRQPTIPKGIFKEALSPEKPQNLNSNYKEKCTPNKSIYSQIIDDRKVASEQKRQQTPQKIINFQPISEPARKSRYTKNSQKVSRNLFLTRYKDDTSLDGHQYSRGVIEDTTCSTISSGEQLRNDSFDRQCATNQTVPFPKGCGRRVHTSLLSNHTAPAVLQTTKDSDCISCGDNSLSSDCESELECLFKDRLNSPRHTSTPKGVQHGNMRHRRRKPSSCSMSSGSFYLCRPSEVFYDGNTDNQSVKKWLEEVGQHYEQECMTTLQCKSVMGELNLKISRMTCRITQRITDIISHAQCIEKEYRTLNSETRHIGPLAQSLAGNIIEYIKQYTNEMTSKLSKQYDQIRIGKDDSLSTLNGLLTTWQSIHCDTLENEVKKLSNRLEDLNSEIDLRATVTGITSLALRNEELIELFVKADIIPTFIILCEKCEGSSVRSLLLRALATMCCSSTAVRQIEKFSGIQIIVESIQDDSRPEPERSEAIALLAQVTAPWIEDNHSIRGLQGQSKKIIKALTKFISSTRCCQNLLLSLAALANLTTMDGKCIKYLLYQRTLQVVLDVVQKRGPLVSVYLLEQCATLLANISAIDEARHQLVEAGALEALLSFLQRTCSDENIEKRLQQKSIIALSRLCKLREAAEQVVEMGGVQILVKLCKEKEMRHDSDAVLVASLATLRKIADVCGTSIVSAEDAQELVEPKLLDSFRAYSSQNESYV